jgi:hypothetical protein
LFEVGQKSSSMLLRAAPQQHSVRNELENGMDVGRPAQGFCTVNSR